VTRATYAIGSELAWRGERSGGVLVPFILYDLSSVIAVIAFILYSFFASLGFLVLLHTFTLFLHHCCICMAFSVSHLLLQASSFCFCSFLNLMQNEGTTVPFDVFATTNK